MANTQNVLVGVPVGGGVYMTPSPVESADYPTGSIGTALTTPYVAAGFISEDGVTETNESDTEKIKAWGGDTVRVVETSHEVTLSWTFLETNSLVLAEVYGAGNVTTTPATSTKGTLNAIAVKGGALPERAYVFEMKDGNKRVRVVAPNFQITEVGDTQFVHSAATGYEVTGEALPDASGVKLYIYTNDGVTTT